MSLKKISKDQPEKFEFGQQSLEAAKKILSPSPTFNCVGPGSVGTGSLYGMRLLNYFYKKLQIWPFYEIESANRSVIVEIFPTYYFRKVNIKPIKGNNNPLIFGLKP